MKAQIGILLTVFACTCYAHAFGPTVEDRVKMKKHRELCEEHLKNVCGPDLEFPDAENLKPSFRMFKKVNEIKKCVKSEAVQKANIPDECKKDIGPGAK